MNHGRTLQQAVELVDTRRNAEVDGLVAEVDDDAAKDGRVHLTRAESFECQSQAMEIRDAPCWRP